MFFRGHVPGKNTSTRRFFAKNRRNRPVGRSQTVEKNPAKRFFDSISKTRPHGAGFVIRRFCAASMSSEKRRRKSPRPQRRGWRGNMVPFPAANAAGAPMGWTLVAPFLELPPSCAALAALGKSRAARDAVPHCASAEAPRFGAPAKAELLLIRRFCAAPRVRRPDAGSPSVGRPESIK